MDYNLTPVGPDHFGTPEDGDECPQFEIPIRAISYGTDDCQDRLECAPAVQQGVAGASSGVSPSTLATSGYISPGYRGNNLWSSAPRALTTAFPSHRFDDPDAIWTYIQAGPGYDSDGTVDECAFWLWGGGDPTERVAFFVNAFVPYLTYQYVLHFDPVCGWLLKVRFWTGLINNFATYCTTWTASEAVREFVELEDLGLRASVWMSGIRLTQATIKTKLEVHGSCDVGGADAFAWSCTDGPFWPLNREVFRDYANMRRSMLGNMLRGQVDFYEPLSTSHTIDELVSIAFVMLFGNKISLRQDLVYLLPSETPSTDAPSYSATVRHCLTFDDAEWKPDFIDRYRTLAAENPNVFQSGDIAWIQADTIT